jgi:ADP-heptose:LPS heptosyltransferase
MEPLDRRMRERAGHRRILIHTGGRGLKGWTLPAFQKLALGLSKEGFDIWVAQGPGAPAFNDAAAGSEFFTLPPMPVASFAQALTRIDRFIGCDSGVMHLAAAVGTPVTGIFRSSDPRRYAPMGNRHQILILGPGARDYLQGGDWPSLAPPLAPRLDLPASGLIDSDPRDQAAWALERILAGVLEPPSAGHEALP